MNKTEFLEQLERLLGDISEQEREEALDFYRSYFEDAGEENEAQVIQELGSPGKVAAIIKADLGESREENRQEHGEYTESGYQDERFREEHMPEKRESSSYGNTEENRASFGKTENQGTYRNYRYTGREHRRPQSGISWPLILVIGIIGILAIPVLFGVGGGAFGLLMGLFFGILGIVLGLFFGGIGCLIGGVAGILADFPLSVAASGYRYGNSRGEPHCPGDWDCMYYGFYLADIESISVSISLEC